jgi:hypothetical protein
LDASERVQAPFLNPAATAIAAQGQRHSGSIRSTETGLNVKWIMLSSKSSVHRLSQFLLHHWRLRRPELLISICGASQDCADNERVMRTFTQSLAHMVVVTSPWILSGDFDTGLMKLTGDARVKWGMRTPLIVRCNPDTSGAHVSVFRASQVVCIQC